MSNTDKNAIHQADKVIAKFGGIRPMATKMGVPVTTVQGWKKRNVIPGRRRDQLIEAAATHDIDIMSVIDNEDVANDVGESAPSIAEVSDAVVVENVEEDTVEEKAQDNDFTVAEVEDPVSSVPRSERKGPPVSSSVRTDIDFDERLNASRKTAVTQSTYINLFLIAVAIGALFAVFWPRVETATDSTQRLTVLEQDVEAVKEEQSSFRGLNLETRLQNLQEQAQKVQGGLQDAMQVASAVSKDVLGEQAGNFEDRIAKLEGHVTNLRQSPALAGLIQRMQSLEASAIGQQQLDESSSELNAVVGGYNGPIENINSVIDGARQRSAALGQTFDGIPQQDLKAAALLVGLAQFRSTLNRDNQPFQNDLQLLMRLVGQDDPALLTSLANLSSHAETGVLTPSGLSSELRSLTGDIVVSSLKGEDVSLQEKAQARLNQVFRVEKEGELITGTETQATMANTQSLLDSGDLEGAIAAVQMLDGPAASAILPWLNKAKATLIAQRVKRMITGTIQSGTLGGITAGGLNAIGGGGQLIQDNATGINILKPAKPITR